MNNLPTPSEPSATFICEMHGVGLYRITHEPFWSPLCNKAPYYRLAVPDPTEPSGFRLTVLTSLDHKHWNLSSKLHFARELRVYPRHFDEIIDFLNAHHNLAS